MQHVGKHQQQIETLFAGEVRYRAREPVIQLPLVVMAFTNRCGSMLLGEYLRLTGNFAGFHEHLNGFTVKGMMESTGATCFPDHVAAIVAQQNKAAVAFGVKASWDQILMLLRWRIDRMFTSLHVIHVERLDVLAQAVSFSIADQTKRWISVHAGSGDKPRYDPTDIRNRLEGIGSGNKYIRQICAVHDLDTHMTRYEDVVADPVRELNRIHRWLGIPLRRFDLSKSRLKKQADAINADFIEAFRAEEVARIRAAQEPA